MRNFKKPDKCVYYLNKKWYRYRPQLALTQPRFSFILEVLFSAIIIIELLIFMDEFWVNEEEWCVLMCVHMYGCAWLVMIECVWSSN